MNRVQKVDVFLVACSGSSDLRGVQGLIDDGSLVPTDIVAVMGKTEGNGCINDHTRDFAATSWCHFLSPHLKCTPSAVAQRLALVMSGGTEGVLSPHFTVLMRRRVIAPIHSFKRLVVGIAHTRDFLPEEMGRAAQIEATAAATVAAMADAGITDPSDVHFVQIKCPLRKPDKVQAALARGNEPVTHDAYELMGFSHGASALGVSVALGEVPPAAAVDASVLSDWSLYSARAPTSAGTELEHNVVIVLGEAAGASSLLSIGHTVMQDAVDAASLRRLLGENFDIDPDGPALQRVLVNLRAKAEANPDGRLRGERHTMLNDSDIDATRHARATMGGVLASVVGHTALYVSGGAEHQGPAGGGPVVALVRVDTEGANYG
jgi:cyanuric acid amidohydrolase